MSGVFPERCGLDEKIRYKRGHTHAHTHTHTLTQSLTHTHSHLVFGIDSGRIGGTESRKAGDIAALGGSEQDIGGVARGKAAFMDELAVRKGCEVAHTGLARLLGLLLATERTETDGHRQTITDRDNHRQR
jgi:hypothetical protein